MVPAGSKAKRLSSVHQATIHHHHHHPLHKLACSPNFFAQKGTVFAIFMQFLVILVKMSSPTIGPLSGDHALTWKKTGRNTEIFDFGTNSMKKKQIKSV